MRWHPLSSGASMSDIVEYLRVVSPDDYDACSDVMNAAADEIERLRNVIYQYRSDLEFPPSADSVQRRLKMIDDVLEGK